jgi:hypothetical protein
MLYLIEYGHGRYPLVTEYRYPGEPGIWRWEDNKWNFYRDHFDGGDSWVDESG